MIPVTADGNPLYRGSIITEEMKIVRANSGNFYALENGEWQCGECDNIHEYDCQACKCLGNDECEC